MLTKRIAIVTNSKQFQRKALPGLMAAGASVDIISSKEEFFHSKAAYGLLVVHFEELKPESVEIFRKMLGKLAAEAQAVAVIPKADLAAEVKLLSLPKCNNVIVESTIDPAILAGIAARHLFGDIFGLEKYLPWGVRVYSMLVGDYAEKSVAIATISDFAATLGVRRKYLEHIEKVIDELLMNALYDAPVDAEGQGVFNEVSARDRIEVKLEQKAIIQYGCDGERFAVSVRDNFGSLKKDVVLKYLDKCLHSEDQIDRKEGGAGLGLYIVTNSVSEYVVNLHPGAATEVICIFDLRTPGLVLNNFGVFVEKIDALGRLGPTGRRRTIAGRSGHRGQAPMPMGLKIALGAAIALLLFASAILLWKDLRPPKTGSLVLNTKPAGAEIRVDGTLRGTTDSGGGLVLDNLEVNRPHAIRASKKGYKDVQIIVHVADGKTTSHDLRLEALKVEIPVRSRPEGAQIHLDGRDTGKTTPATLELEPSTQYKLELRLDDYETATREIVTRSTGEKQDLDIFELKPSSDWGSLRVLSQPPNARVFLDGVMQRGHTPIEALAVQSGRGVMVEINLDGYVPFRQQVQLEPQEKGVIRATLQKGGLFSLETSPATQVTIGEIPTLKTPIKDLALPVGTHTVEIRSRWPYIRHNMRVTISHKKRVENRIVFGIVAAATGHRLQIDGRSTQRVGLTPGTHTVNLANTETGESRLVKVHVKAGQITVAKPSAK